jgi:Na+/melibiose symporter-like transporter
MMEPRNSERSLAQLVAVLVNEVTALFQNEMRLLRAEANDKISRVASSATLIVAGAVGVIAAVFLLLQAIVRWLAVAGMPEEWGYLAVGIVIAAIGAVAMLSGISRLKETNFVPDRTLRQAREDLATVKEHVT